MRKLLEGVAGRLKAFLTQRDDLALVVRCPEAQSVALLQMLDTLAEENPWAMFWTFPEPFGDAEGYVSALVESFAARHELVRLLQEKEEMKVWPALPAAIRNEGLSPARRLRELMVFARSLLPAPEGALLVWGLVPAEVVDRPAHARLLAEVLRHDFPAPWCHHMRILLRDDPANPALSQALARVLRIAWYEPDLSPQALHKALEEEADDEDLPLEERLQALLLTAATDHSHKRHALALEKYLLLFEHYAAQGNHPLTAVALNGMGEVHRALGERAEAGARFEAALVHATDGPEPSLPAVLTIAYNLAGLRTEEKRWAEAEGYFECVQKLATVLRSAALKVTALEQLGQAQYLQGKVPAALETWQAGATVAEELGLAEQHQAILGRLRGQGNNKIESRNRS